MTPEQQQEQREAEQAADEQRQSMLHAIMQPAARERCEQPHRFAAPVLLDVTTSLTAAAKTP